MTDKIVLFDGCDILVPREGAEDSDSQEFTIAPDAIEFFSNKDYKFFIVFFQKSLLNDTLAKKTSLAASTQLTSSACIAFLKKQLPQENISYLIGLYNPLLKQNAIYFDNPKLRSTLIGTNQNLIFFSSNIGLCICLSQQIKCHYIELDQTGKLREEDHQRVYRQLQNLHMDGFNEVALLVDFDDTLVPTLESAYEKNKYTYYSSDIIETLQRIQDSYPSHSHTLIFTARPPENSNRTLPITTRKSTTTNKCRIRGHYLETKAVLQSIANACQLTFDNIIYTSYTYERPILKGEYLTAFLANSKNDFASILNDTKTLVIIFDDNRLQLNDLISHFKSRTNFIIIPVGSMVHYLFENLDEMIQASGYFNDPIASLPQQGLAELSITKQSQINAAATSSATSSISSTLWKDGNKPTRKAASSSTKLPPINK